MTNEWLERLRKKLEPLLQSADPRQTAFSAYHDMPYAIFHYPPAAELELRQELVLLATRLEQHGKRVTEISLTEVMHDLIRDDMPTPSLAMAERDSGAEKLVEQIHAYLSETNPLVDAVVRRVPHDVEPTRDVIFFCRAGGLFPVYRTSALVEHLYGRLTTPAVLFFPGSLAGPAGLSFMDAFPPEHNYRPRIF